MIHRNDAVVDRQSTVKVRDAAALVVTRVSRERGVRDGQRTAEVVNAATAEARQAKRKGNVIYIR